MQKSRNEQSHCGALFGADVSRAGVPNRHQST